MYCKNITALTKWLDDLQMSPDAQLMVFVGDKSAQELDNLRSLLNSRGLRFFGGIFPGLLYANSYMREGFLFQVVTPVYQCIVHPFMLRIPKDLPSLANHTAILLVDGLSNRFRDLVDTAEKKLGNTVAYVGGGAGFYDMSHRPCLFDQKGVYQDAMMLCIVEGKATISVKHGWQKLDGPYTITKSSDNVLVELDGYKAMDIYRDVIEEHANVIISQEDFFTYAKEHPFGLIQEDGSIIVRDPISCSDAGEIICVADVPSNSTVYVLKGDKRTLLASSLDIARDCTAQVTGGYTPLLFNCISRAMFLEDDFHKEIQNIQSQLASNLVGTLSIGEISSIHSGELVIHNKSTILGLIPQQ